MTISEEPKNTPEISPSGRETAAISYVWVMSILVLIFRSDSEFVQFHARQATILFVLSLFVWLIPGIGQLLEVVIAAAMVFGFIQASQGVWYAFPIISDLVSGKLTVDDIKAKFDEVFSQKIDKEEEEIRNEPEPREDDLDLKEELDKEKRKRDLLEKVRKGEV